MEQLRRILEESDTPAGRAVDLAIQGLILVALVSYTLETLPHLSPQAKLILHWIEIAVVVIFTAEYLLRLAVAKPKRDFVFSFYGIIDLLAILPFYVMPAFDLRCVRIFRLLRLFQVLKMLRYHAALQRFRRAFLSAKEELTLFLVVAAMLLYLSAVGIYFFEHQAQPEKFASIVHSLWWAIVTLTSVGYGDTYPITAGGRMFTFGVLLIGLGIIAVPSGLMASALGEARRQELEEAMAVEDEPGESTEPTPSLDQR